MDAPRVMRYFGNDTPCSACRGFQRMTNAAEISCRSRWIYSGWTKLAVVFFVVNTIIIIIVITRITFMVLVVISLVGIVSVRAIIIIIIYPVAICIS